MVGLEGVDVMTHIVINGSILHTNPCAVVLDHRHTRVPRRWWACEKLDRLSARLMLNAYRNRENEYRLTMMPM